MQATQMKERQVEFLESMAARLRIDSVRTTTEAASGHPTSCASAAEIMAVLFFSVMRYDPSNPKNPDNDLFVLSKGHAAPILCAAWAEAGVFPVKHLLTLRRLDSDLEGHPTPELTFVDVATGSLGQGLSAAIGMALNAKRLERQERRIFVLLGDGESAEGSVWEAAQLAAAYQLDNLCATVDINRLGQSQPTLWGHDLEAHRKRWEVQGWQALTVDGHNISELLQAYDRINGTSRKPTVILARTVKGKGFPGIEDKEGYQGRAFDRSTAERIISSLERQIKPNLQPWKPNLPPENHPSHPASSVANQGSKPSQPSYVPGGPAVATRKVFGDALAALASVDFGIVVLEGPSYVRLGRPASPILYSASERFAIGECKVLRRSPEDKVLIVAAGVTVHEALLAHDELRKQDIRARVIDLFSIRPIDQATLIEAAKAVGGRVVTVEDHYQRGGVGDAVLEARAQERVEVHKLAIREIPHSGKPAELLDRYGISAVQIVQTVKALAG